MAACLREAAGNLLYPVVDALLSVPLAPFTFPGMRDPHPTGATAGGDPERLLNCLLGPPTAHPAACTCGTTALLEFAAPPTRRLRRFCGLRGRVHCMTRPRDHVSVVDLVRATLDAVQAVHSGPDSAEAGMRAVPPTLLQPPTPPPRAGSMRCDELAVHLSHPGGPPLCRSARHVLTLIQHEASMHDVHACALAHGTCQLATQPEAPAAADGAAVQGSLLHACGHTGPIRCSPITSPTCSGASLVDPSPLREPTGAVPAISRSGSSSSAHRTCSHGDCTAGTDMSTVATTPAELEAVSGPPVAMTAAARAAAARMYEHPCDQWLYAQSGSAGDGGLGGGGERASGAQAWRVASAMHIIDALLEDAPAALPWSRVHDPAAAVADAAREGDGTEGHGGAGGVTATVTGRCLCGKTKTQVIVTVQRPDSGAGAAPAARRSIGAEAAQQLCWSPGTVVTGVAPVPMPPACDHYTLHLHLHALCAQRWQPCHAGAAGGRSPHAAPPCVVSAVTAVRCVTAAAVNYAPTLTDTYTSTSIIESDFHHASRCVLYTQSGSLGGVAGRLGRLHGCCVLTFPSRCATTACLVWDFLGCARTAWPQSLPEILRHGPNAPGPEDHATGHGTERTQVGLGVGFKLARALRS